MTDKKKDFAMAAAYRANRDIGNNPKGTSLLNDGELGAKVLDQYEGNIRDILTGAFNRRYLEEELEELTTDGKNFALVLIDTDNFKLINDTYGHPMGDVVLKRLVIEFLNDVKIGRVEGSEDSIARWGGDELAIILRNVSDIEVAKEIIERARKHIKGLSFVGEKGEEFRVTISAGVVVNQGKEDLRALIKRVDEALYLAKERGRDQIVSK